MIKDYGKIAITIGGAWSASTAYEKLTAVTRNGQSYLSIIDNTGVDPAIDVDPTTGVGTHWLLIARKGDPGSDATVTAQNIAAALGYVPVAPSDVPDELADLAEDSQHRSVTDTEKAAWNAKYDKPAGGVPKSDMASGVQISLDSADSAYQKPNDGIPETDLALEVQESLGAADTAYQKPSGGIPKADLDAGVKASLDKADTAVQDVSGKAEKSEMSVSKNGDKTTITLKSGLSAEVINEHQSLDGITSLIPEQASAQNQLADKNFVNSSIETNTATFRGTFNLVSDLGLTIAATQAQVAAALANGVSVADNNDYVFVQVPTTDADPTVIARVDRYKYNGSVWGYEWSLNNSSFTAAQWAAINSGVTDTAVSKLAALPTRSELTQEIAAVDDLFWATYGTTTASDIMTAADAGKVVLCLYNNMVYYYAYRTSSVIIFASISVVIPRSICYLSVTLRNNTWSNNNLAVELSGNKKSGWSSFPADENYPSEKLAYDSIYPAVGSSQPSGGFLPNKPYDIGEISGNITFSLASPSDANVTNHYYFAFDTGATAPTITWPANISWVGTAPDIIANKHYEVSIIDGVGVWMEA